MPCDNRRVRFLCEKPVIKTGFFYSLCDLYFPKITIDTDDILKMVYQQRFF